MQHLLLQPPIVVPPIYDLPACLCQKPEIHPVQPSFSLPTCSQQPNTDSIFFNLLDPISAFHSHDHGYGLSLDSLYCLISQSTKAILHTTRKTSLDSPSDCNALFKVLQTFFFALSVTEKDFPNLTAYLPL